MREWEGREKLDKREMRETVKEMAHKSINHTKRVDRRLGKDKGAEKGGSSIDVSLLTLRNS